MHEIEELIRLALKTGPQKGSDVRLWVAEATGFSASKIRAVAADMESRDVLCRNAWCLALAPLHSSIGGSIKPWSSDAEHHEIYRRD